MSGNEGIFLTRTELATLLAFYKTGVLKPFKEDVKEARLFLHQELKTFKYVVLKNKKKSEVKA